LLTFNVRPVLTVEPAAAALLDAEDDAGAALEPELDELEDADEQAARASPTAATPTPATPALSRKRLLVLLGFMSYPSIGCC
jgi:hypothetical protein